MADRSIVVRLRAEVAEFKRQMAEAGQSIAKNRDALDTLSTTAGVTGAGLTALAALAVKSFADFDQAMSNVQAATHETTDNMDALREAALAAGESTVYSATDAAGAVEALAKAGVSTTDILGGGLAGALSLASAGSLDVADAAEYTATALAQFHLSGTQATHVSDLLAAGAGKAMGSVDDLGQALKQGGLVASQTGLSIDETTAALAAFAQQGLIGSDAGTSLKTMLQRLTPQSDQAQKAFDDLGISAYDAQGNFVGLANFAGQLQTKMKSLTPEARNAALSVMFGSDAVRGASVLYSEGAAGIEKWTAAVDDQGYAADTATTKLDNLKGDWEALSGAVQTGLIGMGEGANGPLRSLTQEATNVVNAFNELPDPIQQATGVLAGAGGLSLLGLAALGKLVVGISETKQALDQLKVSGKDAAFAIGATGTALAVATAGLVIWANQQAGTKANVETLQDSLDAMTGSITASTRSVVAARLTKTPDWWDAPLGISASDGAKKLGINLDTLTDAILGNGKAWDEVTAVVGDGAFPDDIAKRAAAAGLSIGDYNKAVAAVRRELQGNAKDLSTARQQQLDMNAAVGDSTTTTDVAKTALETYTDAQAIGTATTKDYVDALTELIDAQSKAAGVALDLFDAQTNIEAAFAGATQSIAENGATLDVTTEKGRSNRDALKEIASAGWDLITSMQANGANQVDLQATMASTRDRFVEVAEKMGLSSGEAGALADQLNLIPANVNVQVAVDTAQAERSAQDFRAELDAIFGNVHLGISSPQMLTKVGLANGGLLPGAIGLAAGGPIKVQPGIATEPLSASTPAAAAIA